MRSKRSEGMPMIGEYMPTPPHHCTLLFRAMNDVIGTWLLLIASIKRASTSKVDVHGQRPFRAFSMCGTSYAIQSSPVKKIRVA